MTNRRRFAWPCGCCVGLFLFVLLFFYAINIGLQRQGLYYFSCQRIFAAMNHDDLAEVKRLVGRKPQLVNAMRYGPKDRRHGLLVDAIDKGHTEIAEFLLIKGADPNAASDSEGTPVVAAARNGDDRIIRLLVSHGVKLGPTRRWRSPLDAAVQNKNWKTCDLLRSFGANDIPFAYEAAAKGDIPLLKREIRKNPRLLNAFDSYRRNAIYFAIDFGQADAVRTLGKLGADVNTNEAGYEGTLLAAACQDGNLDVVKALVESGAELSWKDEYGTETNGLEDAAENGRLKIVQYLLDKGVNPSSNRGKLTCALAYCDGDSATSVGIAKLLEAHGFIPDKDMLNDCGVGNLYPEARTEIQSYLWKHAE